MSETRMTVQLPESILQRLEALARTTERSPSGLAADAIAAYVDLQEWQVERVRVGLREADAGEFASDEEVAAVFAKWLDAH